MEIIVSSPKFSSLFPSSSSSSFPTSPSPSSFLQSSQIPFESPNWSNSGEGDKDPDHHRRLRSQTSVIIVRAPPIRELMLGFFIVAIHSSWRSSELVAARDRALQVVSELFLIPGNSNYKRQEQVFCRSDPKRSGIIWGSRNRQHWR